MAIDSQRRSTALSIHLGDTCQTSLPPNGNHQNDHETDNHSPLEAAPSGVREVVVPAEPPTFTPAAARALLRLLLAVHEKRTGQPNPSRKEPSE